MVGILLKLTSQSEYQSHIAFSSVAPGALQWLVSTPAIVAYRESLSQYPPDSFPKAKTEVRQTITGKNLLLLYP